MRNISLLTPSLFNFSFRVSYKWAVWGIAVLFYLYEYLLRVSPSIMADELMREFKVDTATLSLVSSYYYYTYVLFQIPCGLIVDWLGPRKVITLSAALCAIGSLIFSQTDNIFVAQIARFIIGAGSACVFLSCAKIIIDWFPAHKFGFMMAITTAVGSLGSSLGGVYLASSLQTSGWRNSILITALIGLIITIASWFIIRDKKNTVQIPSHNTHITFFDTLKVVITNPQNWLMGLCGCFMYLPISVFAELWSIPYLKQTYCISNIESSFANTLFFMGLAIGSPFAACLASKLNNYVRVISWSSLLSLCVFLIAIYIPHIPLNFTFFLLFLFGVCCSGRILSFAFIKDLNPTYANATAIGFINSIIMSSGIIFQPLSGIILESTKCEVISTYGNISSYNYQIAFSIIPVGLLLSWILLKVIARKKPATHLGSATCVEVK